MQYRKLGGTDLNVSRICLGTMTFGAESDEATSFRLMDDYVAAGGNFLDTANVYTKGTSERFVGEFVKADRDKWVVATKYSIAPRFDDINKLLGLIAPAIGTLAAGPEHHAGPA